MNYLRSILRFTVPLLILGGCGYAAWWLLAHPPEQEKKSVPAPLVRVEGTVLRKGLYEPRVRSQGTVRPRTRSSLLPEVAGKIVEVSPAFRPGGFFEKDEVLLRLDPLDYETAVVIAQAAQAQAEALLAEEQARADQAVENWKALGRAGLPGAVAARVPQLAKAKADVESAKAQLAKARRDLERTILRAPYAGQVLEQTADVGQMVGPGTTLGQIFAVDYVEVRLPLPERESQFLSLPQPFRDGAARSGGKALLKATVAGKPAQWEGRVVRVESALDETTRQVMAVVQVDDPYGRREDGTPPLTIGAFVEAELAGEPLRDVFVIPRAAVRAGNEIILIDRPQNTLRRRVVEPLVSNSRHIVVDSASVSAPKEGDVLCLTPIPFPADGARVLPTIDGQVESPPVGKKAAKQPEDGEPKPKAPVVSQNDGK
ncbi:MAG TPA: efflux RND transporter periplasmic adaptor subunit [Prosthecobacter sp.]|nr:efflux RND transporter periplasmic adaptor subunit [Prosthecobacter sp.]